MLFFFLASWNSLEGMSDSDKDSIAIRLMSDHGLFRTFHHARKIFGNKIDAVNYQDVKEVLSKKPTKEAIKAAL